MASERMAWFFALALLISTLVFLLLVRIHQKIAYRRKHYGFLKDINLQEMMRLDGMAAQLPADGSEFADPLHPYTGDLDIFGKNSLFQYLHRCTTLPGKNLLAQWLRQKADSTQIRLRQQAVEELATQHEWLQDFEATGRHHHSAQRDMEALWDWLDEAPLLLPQTMLLLAARLMPLLTLLALGLYIAIDLSGWYLLLALLINSYLLRQVFKPVTAAIEKTARSLNTLKAAAALIKKIEDKSFSSQLLQNARQSLHEGSAGRQLRQLADIVGKLEMRSNAYFYLIFNGLFLWDIHWMRRLEHWKQQHRHSLRQWLDTVALFEAAGSLAGLRFAQPDFVMPQPGDEDKDDFYYLAEGLGHPLIHASRRVSNDVQFRGRGQAWVVTGSNMSGKSTFLRTMGINAVLAMAGAPVCAQRFHFVPVQVFTSMRTQDSLSESVSSFYAELKRIRQLLMMVEQGQEIFYLLDEILKGTNSRDRHNGARALIRQLTGSRSSGLVSTHDLELGSLEAELPGKIQNYNFSSELHQGQLFFPYRLQPGICSSFNASVLMQQMGIKMDEGF